MGSLIFKSREASAGRKAPGDSKVLIQMGDFYHNGVMQEQSWRRVLGATDWRLLFAQSSDDLTPELLSECDLLVIARYATDTQDTNFSLGWSPETIVEHRPRAAVFMTDDQEDAIIENVRRGMGLLALHCTIWNPKKQKFLKILGVEKPIMHTKVQPAYIHRLNAGHPITAGIQPFETGDDEIFNAVMIPDASETLFYTRGEEEPIDAFGGWCREEGEGRIVALLPGHTQGPYMQRPYREIMWRAAHWAMKREIAPSPHVTDKY